MQDDKNRSLRIVLSYSHGDRGSVRKLYSRLIKEGMDVWIDYEKLLPGQNFVKEFFNALREKTDVVIICLSKEFNQDSLQKDITEVILDFALKNPNLYIIPTRLEECEIPINLRKFQYVDLFNENYERLVHVLRLRAESIGIRHGETPLSMPNMERLEERESLKRRVEAESKERQAVSKEVREKAERQATEKVAREKAERQAIEKMAREKAERQAIEKMAREKAEKQAAEKMARVREQREMPRQEMSRPKPNVVNRREEMESYDAEKKSAQKHRISVAHPKFLSKRYSSLFLIQAYLPEMRQRVTRTLTNQFNKDKITEHIHNSDLGTGTNLTLKLSSPEIIFSDSVSKRLDKGILSTNFIAKPKDSCHPGTHQVILTICDSKTNLEYQSIVFSVQITDFVFDHVSRPFLSNTTSALLGIGSLFMFILTLIGQIDTTFGLTSGTIAGALASAVYVRFFSLYQHNKITTVP
jgi:hypothetical protein